ncbi:MAG: hypothetical protein ACLTYN_09150 [Dysosmobacter welbionis]
MIYGDCASRRSSPDAWCWTRWLRNGHTFTYTKVLMGGEAIDAYDPAPVGTGQVPAKPTACCWGPSAALVGGPAR